MSSDATDTTIALGGFTFATVRLELRDPSGALVELRAQALAVLRYLATQRNHVVTRDELMRAVWGDVIVTDGSLAQCVAEIRRALGDTAHSIVQTVPKRGYRLMSEGAAATAAPAPAGGFEQVIGFATGADGARIAYAASGEGPILLRAPHWMTHLDWDWRSLVYGPWIEGLSQRFRLVRYDGRNWGLSDRGVAPATLERSTSDMAAVADAAGLGRFALLGVSGGGAIAIRFAALHPERVSHLVLVGCCARGGLRRGAASITAQHLDAYCRLIEDGWAQDNAAFRQIMTSQMYPGASADEMHSFNEMQRVACTPQEAANIRRLVADYDASEHLPDVRCPTLVLHNPHDAMVPFEESRLVASSIAGARLVPFDSPNHVPLCGEAAFAQMNRLIDEFVLGDAPAKIGAHTSNNTAGATALPIVASRRR
ncbi:alpha/beta fold hydrolase [Ideonella sp. YS5]|uniref:alpha/beta fold hydrolase n=1 Tax=Ideonella sp. YS5 TaxID=3453714 RepID=UPI003EEC04D7